MADHDWLWNDQLGIPEAEDVGPALADADLDAWESRHGVPLPPILRRAYRQQDGGYIRAPGRAISVLRLRDVGPIEENLLDDLLSGNEGGGRLDPARLFYLGGDDDRGATLLLHYGEPDGAAPAVYAFWSDGAAVERLSDTVAGLFTAETRTG